MKSPRFSISVLMALVLVVALDFGAVRGLIGGPLLGPDLSDLVIYGALPMANVLAIGLIAFLGSRPGDGGGSPALAGFVIFGMAALLLYLGCSLLATRLIHEGVGAVLRAMGLSPGPNFLAGAVALLLLPQLALALLGGRLGRTYKIRVKIVIERRSLFGTEPGPDPERLLFADGVSP